MRAIPQGKRFAFRRFGREIELVDILRRNIQRRSVRIGDSEIFSILTQEPNGFFAEICTVSKRRTLVVVTFSRQLLPTKLKRRSSP
jgi:hypothetical protein